MIESESIIIDGRCIALGGRAYIVAELSANHRQSFDRAVALIKEAKACGADAVKLQTYTPDTITIDCKGEYFRVGDDTIWAGRNLHDLYGEAYTPWEWQPRLKEIANSLGLALFSTPFDPTAVAFLEEMAVPAYKIASFEVIDIPLLEIIGATGKPVIMSTGMATLAEIDEALSALVKSGCTQIALLKCTSAYPAQPEDMKLATIPHMAAAFGVPVGLSDHTLGIAVPVAAVALGACIIEKHLTISRSDPGPDSAFSLEPHEFKQMVEAVRVAEKAGGQISYGGSASEAAERVFRRSLFVVEDVKAGELFTEKNVRSIRPGQGLPPKLLPIILGRRARIDISRGTPLRWDLIR
jgi:N-acetylneuraminate synthase